MQNDENLSRREFENLVFLSKKFSDRCSQRGWSVQRSRKMHRSFLSYDSWSARIFQIDSAKFLVWIRHAWDDPLFLPGRCATTSFRSETGISIMITKNFLFSELVNGKLIFISTSTIRALLLATVYDNGRELEILKLPRITSNFSIHTGNATGRKILVQVELVLTVHKAQHQVLKMPMVDLRSPFFSSVELNMASFRVRKSPALLQLSKPEHTTKSSPVAYRMPVAFSTPVLQEALELAAIKA